MIDDCKVQNGANSKAMPTLVGLLKESTPIGKRDAAYNPKSIAKAILVKTKCPTHEIKQDEFDKEYRQILFHLTRF